MESGPAKPAGPKGESGNGIAYLILLGVVAAASVAIPAALGAGLFFATRRLLARRDYLLLAAAGLAGFAVDARGEVGDYVRWLAVLVGAHHGSRLALPWLALATAAVTLAAAAGLAQNTWVARKMPTLLGRKSNPLQAETITPTDKERKAIASIATPPGALTISAEHHSVFEEHKPGERAFPLGVDRRGVPVLLSEQEVGTHGMILGATGSGKTELIKTLMGALLDLGWSGVLLDLKEDTKPGGLRDFCHDYALYHRMPYQELRLSDPNPQCWFNPLHGMGPDEARDTILSLNEFDDAFWQAINKKTLGQVINLFFYAHQADPITCKYPTMYDIGRALGGPSLQSGTKVQRGVVKTHMPHVSVEEEFAVLHNPSQDEAKSAIGFGAKLTQMYDTQAGRTVLRPSGDRRLLDVTEEGLTYIGLDTLGKADLTRIISSAVLQRMSVYAAQRTTGQGGGRSAPAPRFLIVDEANWVDRRIVMNLLSRARSAGIVVFLATQGPRDWIDERGDDFSRLSNNTNISLLLKQNDPVSAEMCADLIGKAEQYQLSQRVVAGELFDAGTTRLEEVHRVKPEAIRALGVGEAILRVGTTGRVLWVKMPMRDPRSSARR